eukprot:CAMPEP_0194076354 /NCGR_PEP_ID=MMETSP0149-20130528/3161_1 /TAXON_ID=122233 /ORGANISM="Chaetoceros debilis, Strain MM31A-1" /LENGTH=209 /DNA_ID=CAMNT_0038757073 /DNA_START=305 /DNA_END=935 /DNA_ORIENTATION=+
MALQFDRCTRKKGKEDRREYVLKHLIHKKVLSQSEKANDDAKTRELGKRFDAEDDVERGNNHDTQEVTSQGETQSISSRRDLDSWRVKDQLELVLPHEEELSLRLQENNARGVNLEDTKNDIYVESLRSIRTNTSISMLDDPADEECHADSLYSPKTCPICFEDYKKGDDIAWSKNEKCHHAYHVDCIMQWLMENDDCPMCREQYVVKI